MPTQQREPPALAGRGVPLTSPEVEQIAEQPSAGGNENTSPIAQAKFGPAVAESLTASLSPQNLIGHAAAVLVQS